MIADTLPQIWQTHPEEILSGLYAIKRMSNTCTKEMQTVMLDLYPNKITEKPLSKLVREMAHKITYHNSVKISVCIDERHSKLPTQVQIVAYRSL